MSDRQLSVEIDGIFAVTPKMDCPHVEVQLDADISHYNDFELTDPCQDCRNVGENWICLVCKNVKCSRYVNSHGVAHFNETSHCLALSMCDLSVWCYSCDKYIEHDSLYYILKHFRELKYGTNIASLTRDLEELRLDNKPAKPALLQTKTLQDLALGLKSQEFKKIAILVGAGISVSAGIPDFRSPGIGLRASLMELSVETPETLFEINYFRSNPDVFFKVIHRLIGDFKPTPTHYFIKLLEQKGLLVQCYTQNIDGLEVRAGVDRDLVTHAHGHLEAAHCSFCGLDFDLAVMKQHLINKTVARCECGGPAKPDIVFFGEPMIPGFFSKVAMLDDVDLLLIMGTSLKVFPFAGLVNQVKDNIPRVMLNKEATGQAIGLDYDNSSSRDVFIQGDTDSLVGEIVRHSGWEEEYQALLRGE
mmetsp:Transcript_3417/g.7110  ORF Transcript_3417/g.7110 Transcript_3417/m.7110 type:complete len:418 (-) Transcript_3417:1331-2584(-)